MENLVKTTYDENDVIFLLQNMEGKVPILHTKEREILNQKGVHYSEMLPVEYRPTEDYMSIYDECLNLFSGMTANCVASLSMQIYEKKGDNVVLVSLARAGTPVGILIKRYLKFKYDIDVCHYSISIVRGKGIDICAMNHILKNHEGKDIQFIDGWVGKGAISNVLDEACKDFSLDSTLAVLSDPANVTTLCGTREDFLIPSSCLNATITGLVSRTVKLKNMTDDELHGAIYYENLLEEDKSMEFLDIICSHFDKNFKLTKNVLGNEKGVDEVIKIAKEFNIGDINKIKPGVGETTRVLLRRLPERVLIKKDCDEKYIKHIKRLCVEKNVPVEYYELKHYNCCGLILDVSDL